ncbi:hypothetical protein Tco_0466074 [Tanacetum coccineum]
MDSQSTQTIKLPILQPGEYDLWKMRMEQYLQCIDYTLWEIVENGNAPIVTKTVDGKETVIPPTSVEEKAQRRAELKARSTLLMALPNENIRLSTHRIIINPEPDVYYLTNNMRTHRLHVDVYTTLAGVVGPLRDEANEAKLLRCIHTTKFGNDESREHHMFTGLSLG